MEEKLKKLEELVTKELEQIGEKGLTSANLETTYKLMDILKIKILKTIQKIKIFINIKL